MTKKKFSWVEERRKFLDRNPELARWDKELSALENFGLRQVLAQRRGPANWVRYEDIDRLMRHMNFPINAKSIFLDIIRNQSRFGVLKPVKEK